MELLMAGIALWILVLIAVHALLRSAGITDQDEPSAAPRDITKGW